ncbi:hypothetical protein TNCV_3941301 [Trichonephila clavipes]|uniref:Uncharacterized protein n=1 Tax=Trichonephila clavipes TaxID=2585209 RepID=A0A8X6VVR8_TRICX|nr:hypothetical protein TNCV_3941301 [Trichonephila clavipes]
MSFGLNEEENYLNSPNEPPFVALSRTVTCGVLKATDNDKRIYVGLDQVGRGSLMVKVGSWLACHEFESSTTKDPPYRGAIHVKSVESTNVLPLVRGGS